MRGGGGQTNQTHSHYSIRLVVGVTVAIRIRHWKEGWVLVLVSHESG